MSEELSALESIEKGVEELMDFERRLRELASELTEKSTWMRYTRFVLRREDCERLWDAMLEVDRIREELESLSSRAPSGVATLLRTATSLANRARYAVKFLLESYERFGEKPVQVELADEDPVHFQVASAIEWSLGERGRDLVKRATSVKASPGDDVAIYLMKLRNLVSILREALERLANR